MHLQTVNASASPEVQMNENFDAVDPVSMFGRKATTTTGLTWGYYGGNLNVDGADSTIADGTVALTGSTTNYVEATRAGVVSKNTTGFTAGRIRLYEIVTGTASVTSYIDRRDFLGFTAFPRVSYAVTAADVTLSGTQARAVLQKSTGVLTGNRAVIVPTVEWLFVADNQNTGAFTTTWKTAAGTGIAVPQGTRQLLYCDGTNVVEAVTGIVGNVTLGGSLAVTGATTLNGNVTLGDASGDTVTITGTLSNLGGSVLSGSMGVPGIVATGRSTAQTAAVASVSTFTVGAVDASFEVSANVLPTTSTTHNFTVTCAYTDEGNTSRTLTLAFSKLDGSLVTAITDAVGAVPYAGVPVHIRVKSGTTITIATTGVFTTVTYNVEGIIKRTK